MVITQLQWKTEKNQRVLMTLDQGGQEAFIPGYAMDATELRELIRAGQECLQLLEGTPPVEAGAGGGVS